MHQGVRAKCLMFAGTRVEIPEMLEAALEKHGIRLVWPCESNERFDLLAKEDWRFLLIDASGGAHGALSALLQARQLRPDVPVLVLVNKGDTQMAIRVMKAGAADCVEIPIDPNRLISAIRPFSGRTDRQSHDGEKRLTPVERVVLRHVLDSRTNRQIGDLLCRSPRTVEVHRRHIMRKLGVNNLVGLVKRGMEQEA